MKILRVTVKVVAAVILLGVGAIGVDYLARHFWEKRVWRCYSTFTKAERAPLEFVLPSPCRADAVLISELGQPSARVVLVYSPPKAMWLSYAFRKDGYDSYSIEITPEAGGHRVALHHGSD